MNIMDHVEDNYNCKKINGDQYIVLEIGNNINQMIK